MRAIILSNLAFLFVLLVSCSSDKLPPIKDPAKLRKDCSLLYKLSQGTNNSNSNYDKSMTMELILKDNWPSSVNQFNPVGVYRNRSGIIVIIKNKSPRNFSDWVSKGYYIVVKHENDVFPGNASPPFSDKPVLFRYNLTGYEDIYEVEQPAGRL